MRRTPIGSALIFLACTAAAADVVHLKSGARVVGRIEERGERVRIVVDGGTMTFAAGDVVSIEQDETPRQRFARRRGELAKGDLAGALELANLASAAGLPAEKGALLELAVSWSGDASVRRLLDRWRAFEREIPPDPDAEKSLAAALGPEAKIHRTAHWRIACEGDLAGARRRGEMLEAAWRKFHSLAERAEIETSLPGERLEAMIFHEYGPWVAATLLPAERVRSMVGIYQPRDGRILLYDARTSPEARGAQTAVEKEIAALAEAHTALDEQKAKLAKLEQAIADGTAARVKGGAQVADLAEWLAAARAEIAKGEEGLLARERDLATFREELARHYGQENVAATTHEACHQIAFAAGVSRAGQPTWLIEGLATLFEAQSRTTFVLEAANEPRLADLRAAWRQGAGGKLADVVTDANFRTPGGEQLAYAESWALTSFLLNRHRAEFVRLLAEGALLPEAAGTAKARIEDFRRLVGGDISAIEREWREYVERL